MTDSREQAISTGYNIVTGNDGEWHPDRTLEAIRAVYEAGVAAERERILGQIEWLMNARNEYTDERVHEHMHVVENLLRVLRGADFAAEGWLPSWRWDEWAAIRADREPEPEEGN